MENIFPRKYYEKILSTEDAANPNKYNSIVSPKIIMKKISSQRIAFYDQNTHITAGILINGVYSYIWVVKLQESDSSSGNESAGNTNHMWFLETKCGVQRTLGLPGKAQTDTILRALSKGGKRLSYSMKVTLGRNQLK